MSDVMEFVNCAKMESDNKSTSLRISKRLKTSLLHEYQMEVSIELFCALIFVWADSCRYRFNRTRPELERLICSRSEKKVFWVCFVRAFFFSKGICEVMSSFTQANWAVQLKSYLTKTN